METLKKFIDYSEIKSIVENEILVKIKRIYKELAKLLPLEDSIEN